MGRSEDGSLSIRPSPLSLFRFHLSPFPQKGLILRLDDGKRDILWKWPNRYLEQQQSAIFCSPWMVSRFTATVDWSTVWVSSGQPPLSVTDKSPGNPLNKTITLPNCTTLRQTNSPDALLACSRRSDNGVRREAREREKNKGEKRNPTRRCFFMLTSLHAVPLRSECLEKA